MGGGRDGALRVWDTRAPGPVVRPSSQSNSWTLGVRTKDLHAGAINSVAGAADGRRIFAATQEGPNPKPSPNPNPTEEASPHCSPSPSPHPHPHPHPNPHPKQEGCVLTWDVRALNAPQSCTHVASAVGAYSGSSVPYAAECVLRVRVS